MKQFSSNLFNTNAGGHTSGWEGELDGRGRPVSKGGCVNVEGVGEVLRGEVVDSLDGEE